MTASSAETAFKLVLFTPVVNMTLRANDWWIDTRANMHVCFDQSLFSTFHVSDRGTMTKGNNVVVHVLAVGRINLKSTSVKTLTLQDVHHVPKIRRNLISGSLLVQ